MPRLRSWTDAELLASIAASTTWTAVARGLGLEPGGGTHAVLRRHAERLNADVRHLPAATRRLTSGRRLSDADLRSAVAESVTLAEVARRLGYQPSGGTHRHLKSHIVRLDLDTRHFLGRSWARGRKFDGRIPARSLEELLVVGSTIAGSRLLRRLIDAGLKMAQCEGCGRTEWQGQPIPLELDHVNGLHTDNRLENLRVLCPNCHALTSTYCGRNRGRVVELAYTAALGAVASA